MAIYHESRITLRPFKESDAEDVLLWASDERVIQNTRLELCNSRELALHFIKKDCIYPFQQSICLDDHSIGIVFVLPISYAKFKADLGFAIGFNYWGQGIATKALKILLSRVFQEFSDLQRLEANILVDNMASQRVLEKVGFQREGLFRKVFNHNGVIVDAYIFSFLSTDEIPHDVV